MHINPGSSEEGNAHSHSSPGNKTASDHYVENPAICYDDYSKGIAGLMGALLFVISTVPASLYYICVTSSEHAVSDALSVPSFVASGRKETAGERTALVALFLVVHASGWFLVANAAW